MENLSRNELMLCNGGNILTAISSLFISSICIIANIKRWIKRGA